MFDILPNLLTTLLAYLLPIYFSHKAIRSSANADPKSLLPWLTYFLVLTLLHVGESVFPLLPWFIPFYAWLRLGVHIYLLLPGENRGANFLYYRYVGPFFIKHETKIEDTLMQGVNTLSSFRFNDIRRVVDWVLVNLLGFKPSPPAPASPRSASTPSRTGYLGSMLSRFNAALDKDNAAGPSNQSAQPSVPASNNDVYSLLTSALSSASSSLFTGSLDSPRANDIIPPNLTSPKDRYAYIDAQRERLRTLLGAFDREASQMSDDGSVKRNVSEPDFDRINPDEADGEREHGERPQDPQKAGWGTWIWGADGEKIKHS